MRKKSFCKILTLSCLCTPFIVLMVINLMRVKPESYKPIFQTNAVEVKNVQQNSKSIPKESEKFLNGYRDGWNKKWLGPINWKTWELNFVSLIFLFGTMQQRSYQPLKSLLWT